MKGKILVLGSMLSIIFTVVVPIVFASSPFVIGEEKAGGYQYTVIKEQNTFTWKIGYQYNLYTIEENKDNTKELELYRIAVEDINMYIFKLIISASYIFIVLLLSFILYKKNKQLLKSSGAIIVIFSGIALYFTTINFIELNTAFQDAKYYYSILTN